MPYYRARYLRVPYRPYRRFTPRGGRPSGAGAVLAVAGAALVLGAAPSAVHAAAHHPHAHHAHRPASHTAAVAIAYARHQIGKPYLWGGTGPGAYDCSGLVMEAYAAAGVSIPRTSQTQWAGLRHVPPSDVRPGDLVFFAGSDGSWSAPGHVALYIGRDRIIQAYETGTNIMTSSYGIPGSLGGVGPGDVIGYARP